MVSHSPKLFTLSFLFASSGNFLLFLGFYMLMSVKEKQPTEPLSFDRFFLTKGLRAGLCLMLLGMPYGMLTSYMTLYAKELHVSGNLGHLIL